MSGPMRRQAVEERRLSAHGSSGRPHRSGFAEHKGSLCQRSCASNNAEPFLNREYLVYLDVDKLLGLPDCGPSHLNQIDCLFLTYAKMNTQIALGHDAPTAADLIDLLVLAHYYPYTGPDRCAI